MLLFVTFHHGGHEKADEQAKDGAMMHGGLTAQVRASAVQQARAGGAHSTAVRSLLSLSGGGMARL